MTDSPDPKLVASLQARSALAGYSLEQMADGSFVIGRWGLVSALSDVAAVEAFLARVESKPRPA